MWCGLRPGFTRWTRKRGRQASSGGAESLQEGVLSGIDRSEAKLAKRHRETESYPFLICQPNSPDGTRLVRAVLSTQGKCCLKPWASELSREGFVSQESAVPRLTKDNLTLLSIRRTDSCSADPSFFFRTWIRQNESLSGKVRAISKSNKSTTSWPLLEGYPPCSFECMSKV